MAKFSGMIGYVESVETEPGIWQEQITEHKHTGDVNRNTSKWVASDNLNDNLTISNQISILADTYAFEKHWAIRYVKFMGAKWEVTNVEVKYPRLILSLGGLYNG